MGVFIKKMFGNTVRHLKKMIPLVRSVGRPKLLLYPSHPIKDNSWLFRCAPCAQQPANQTDRQQKQFSKQRKIKEKIKMWEWVCNDPPSQRSLLSLLWMYSYKLSLSISISLIIHVEREEKEEEEEEKDPFLSSAIHESKFVSFHLLGTGRVIKKTQPLTEGIMQARSPYVHRAACSN